MNDLNYNFIFFIK